MIFRRKVAKSCTFHDLRQKWHESSKSGRKLQSHTKSAKSCGRCPKKSHEICEKLRKVPEKVTRNLRKVAEGARKSHTKSAKSCSNPAKSSPKVQRFSEKSPKFPKPSISPQICEKSPKFPKIIQKSFQGEFRKAQPGRGHRRQQPQIQPEPRFFF
jgi:hypothetical protein